MEHAPRLFDIRMKDGSRQFADVPERLLPSQMRKLIAKLPGATIVSFTASVGEIEAWIEFRFRGFDFAVNNLTQDGYRPGYSHRCHDRTRDHRIPLHHCLPEPFGAPKPSTLRAGPLP